jgi:excisionase family DNA binding protein
MLKLEKRTLTIPEAAQVLGISKNLAYDMAAQDKLPVVRLGRSVLVPIAMLNKYLGGESIEERKSEVARNTKL